jgi:hypothetical protein
MPPQATRIQQNFRAFAIRRRVSRWDQMAGTLQSAFRGYLAREYVRKKRVDVYATKLQSVFRGWKGRRRATGVQGGKEEQAATAVQAMWRGRNVRQAILRDMYHWCAAFQIQRAFRKKLRKKDGAATKMQGMWRTKQARGEMGRRQNRKGQIIELRGKRRSAAITMQRWFRQKYLQRMPLHTAAVKVQAVYRGILGRKVAARERFLFEQKYGNYKEFMLDMYAQIEGAQPDDALSAMPGAKVSYTISALHFEDSDSSPQRCAAQERRQGQEKQTRPADAQAADGGERRPVQDRLGDAGGRHGREDDLAEVRRRDGQQHGAVLLPAQQAAGRAAVP